MKVCSHCGTYNEEWMTICQKCGKSVENSDVDETYTPTVNYETEETSSTTNYSETEESNETSNYDYKEESSSNNKTLLLENMDLKLVILVLLIIFFVLLILVLKG